MDIKAVLSHWNKAYKKVSKITDHLWLMDNQYYLKASTIESQAKNLGLYKELKKAGMPIPEIIKTSKGTDYCSFDGKYYWLYRAIEGTHIRSSDLIGNHDVAVMVGKVVGGLHLALASVAGSDDFDDVYFMEEMNGWVKREIHKMPEAFYCRQMFETCISDMGSVYGSLKKQWIHRDIHLENLIFREGEFAGYIDFDLTQKNARIFDVAYFLINFMVGKSEDVAYIKLWKNMCRSFLEGYQTCNKLSKVERSSLTLMMACIEILFVAYFFSIEDDVNARKADDCLRWLWNEGEGLIII